MRGCFGRAKATGMKCGDQFSVTSWMLSCITLKIALALRILWKGAEGIEYNRIFICNMYGWNGTFWRCIKTNLRTIYVRKVYPNPSQPTIWNPFLLHLFVNQHGCIYTRFFYRIDFLREILLIGRQFNRNITFFFSFLYLIITSKTSNQKISTQKIPNTMFWSFWYRKKLQINSAPSLSQYTFHIKIGIRNSGQNLCIKIYDEHWTLNIIAQHENENNNSQPAPHHKSYKPNQSTTFNNRFWLPLISWNTFSPHFLPVNKMRFFIFRQKKLIKFQVELLLLKKANNIHDQMMPIDEGIFTSNFFFLFSINTQNISSVRLENLNGVTFVVIAVGMERTPGSVWRLFEYGWRVYLYFICLWEAFAGNLN